MLILTRKPGESIRIGEDIEITVVKTSGNRVKLSFNAPQDVSICRGELLFSDLVPIESKSSQQRLVAQPV